MQRLSALSRQAQDLGARLRVQLDRRELRREVARATDPHYGGQGELIAQQQLRKIDFALFYQEHTDEDVWREFARWAVNLPDRSPDLLTAALRVAPGDPDIERRVANCEEALRDPLARAQLMQSTDASVLLRLLPHLAGPALRHTFRQLAEREPAAALGWLESPAARSALRWTAADLAPLLQSSDASVRLGAIRLSATLSELPSPVRSWQQRARRVFGR